MDFVFARIAIVSQSTCLAFYLLEVCGFKAADRDGDGDPDGSPYQLALAAATSFIGSFLYSCFIQEHLQARHEYDKYNLFLYSTSYFIIAGLIIFFVPTDDPFWMETMVYIGLFVQGLGMANMMNTSTSLVSEMIG